MGIWDPLVAWGDDRMAPEGASTNWFWPDPKRGLPESLQRFLARRGAIFLVLGAARGGLLWEAGADTLRADFVARMEMSVVGVVRVGGGLRPRSEEQDSGLWDRGITVKRTLDQAGTVVTQL